MPHCVLALGIRTSLVPVLGSITNLPREIFLTISRLVHCIHLPITVSDFLSQYGVTVTESSVEIRNAFVRKVYTILCAYPSIAFLGGADVPVLCCSCSNREYFRMIICLYLIYLMLPSQLATTIVGGFLSQSQSTIFWVQTQ